MTAVSREEVQAVITGLKQVANGKIYEAHLVRNQLAAARLLERRLRRWSEALYVSQRAAEQAFLEGWPRAKGAPWRID